LEPESCVSGGVFPGAEVPFSESDTRAVGGVGARDIGARLTCTPNPPGTQVDKANLSRGVIQGNRFVY